MPTVIDSFVAEFTIDPAGTDDGAQKVRVNLKRVRDDVDKSGKDFELFGKRSAAMLSQIRNEAVGLFLAFQGASSVKSFISDLINGDAATGRLAGNLGIATNTLSAWQLAVQSLGGDAKDADAALSSMAAAFRSYQLTGTTGHDADFKGLGVTLGDLQDPEQALLKMAEAAERLTKPEFYARMQRLGIPDSVINTLERGRKATEALIAEKKRDGAATDADAAAAQRMQEKLNDFSNHLRKFVRPAIYEVVTALDGFLTDVDNGTVKTPKFQGVLDLLGGVAKNAAKGLDTVATAIDLISRAWDRLKSLGDSMPTWLKDLAAFGERWINPFGRIGSAVEGLDRSLGGPGSFAPSISGARSGGGITPQPGGGPTIGMPGWTPGGARAAPGVDHGYIQRYLSGAGLSAEQVRGIDAGITAEGGSLGMAANGAFGIGQWRGARAQRLFARYGRNPNLQQQLEFLLWELRGGDHGGGSVLAQSSAEAALVAYLRDFMRPQGAHNERYQDLINDVSRGYTALGRRGGAYPAAGRSAAGGHTTNIGTIVVNDASGNADHVAAKLPHAIRRRKLTTQANRGMQ